jgi:5-methylthioadenosine/S-adenosylhomocysteine deaminase
MAMTAIIHKGISGNPVVVTASDCFQMATKNAAKAIGLGGITGEIKAGMGADLAIFLLDRPELTPLTDPISALCYSSGGLVADTVMVGGKTVLRGGEFTEIDIERVLFEVNSRAKRLGIIK